MPYIPLAEKLRPQTLDQVVGQEHLLCKDGWIKRTIENGKPFSILLWGPPGCGKTTLAKLYAHSFQAKVLFYSAATQGILELKKAIQDYQNHPLFASHLIIFIDEIHRFNKSQQDSLLAYVETGTITLIGATTENPSFSINNALLSRLHTLILHPLKEEELMLLLERAHPPLTEDAKVSLIKMAEGDARHLLNMLETLSQAPASPLLDSTQLHHFVHKKLALYDKGEEGHYNLISALHKAVRGSDPDASLYWLARMLNGGEDPRFIARRIVRMASEDIGLADPTALQVALHASQAYEQLGSPEGELALAQAILYLALSPKSNACYIAFKKALKSAEANSHTPPPKIILNAPTKFMKDLGYGKGYLYDHEQENGFSGQNYFPDGMKRETFYQPVERGFERDLQKRLSYFNKLRDELAPS